jgi:Mg2+/Co2+ transporter CorB
MAIMLGNFSVADMEERLGIKLPEEKAKELNAMRYENANNIPADKWHCFDIPFTMLCGSRETAVKVYDILKPYSSSMKCALQIAIGEG